MATDFWKLFKPAACSVKLKGKTQEDVFGELVTNLVRAKRLPQDLAETALEALMERETLASTGVGLSVAIPHVKVKGLEEALVAVSIHQEGVEWKAVDGGAVHILFTVLRPERAGDKHDPDVHLELMRWISGIGRMADFRRFAMAVSTRTELVDLLKEMSATL